MTRDSASRLVLAVRLTCGLLLACGLLSCGSDDGAADGDFNATCRKNSDCDKGQNLLCVGAGVNPGICSGGCATDADCAKYGGDTKCVGAGVNAGYCYETCTDSVSCPRTHTCTMTATEAFSTCRASS